MGYLSPPATEGALLSAGNVKMAAAAMLGSSATYWQKQVPGVGCRVSEILSLRLDRHASDS